MKKIIFIVLIAICLISFVGVFLNGGGTRSSFDSKEFNTNVTLKNEVISAEFESRGAGLKFSMAAPKTIIKKEKDADIYEISKDTTLKYEILKEGSEKGLKETIILNNKSAQNSYSFDLTLDNVKTFLPEPQQKSWQFYNDKNELVFYIPAGFMVDAKGVRSEEVKIGITKKTGNNYVLAITADRKWLDDPARAYPVSIDPSVIVSGGFTETEAQFGSLQRKVVYVNSNWYAFYTNGTDVLYQKSSDGVTWGSPVDVDTSDTDNFSPTVWLEGSLIYVGWIDDSVDALEVNTIDTASSDALGTKCTGADQGTLDNTNMVSLAVADDGTVYLAYSDTSSDTEFGTFKLVFSGCTFTQIDTVTNIESTATTAGGTGTSVTWAHTVSGSERFLLVQVNYDDATSTPAITSVTYNGSNLTFINGIESTYLGIPFRVEQWYMVAPDTGTHNVVVTFPSSIDEIQPSGSSNWVNINQSTPIGTGNTASGNSTTPSVNVSSASTEWVADDVFSPANSPTLGAGQSLLWGSGSSYEVGSATTTMSWTITSRQWVIAAVPIKTTSFLNSSSGLTASDRPVLVTVGNNLHMIYQDGNLSHSVFNGSTWTSSNTTIAAVTDSVYSLTTDGTDLWVLTVSGTTATNFYEYSGGSWSTKTAPWTGQTNLTQVSITYDSGNDDLYASVVKDASEQAYWKSTDAGSISWSGETSFGYTAGDLGQLSMPLSVTSAILAQTSVLRQGSNYEYSGPTPTPTPTPGVIIQGGVKIQGGTKIQ